MSTTDKSAKQAPAPSSSVEATAVTAGAALAKLLPSTGELTPGVAQPAALVDPAQWAGAAVAVLAGTPERAVGVLVGEELVSALAEAPMGPVELGAAVQPALDAAATALGTTAATGQTVDRLDVAAVLAGASVAVPLLSEGSTAAVFFYVSAEQQSGSQSGVPSLRTVVEPGPVSRPGIELLHGVAMEVTVELGRTRLSVRELLALTPGDVLELDRAAGSPADLLVNGRLIARGEVVVVDEDFALRVTEIVASAAAS